MKIFASIQRLGQLFLLFFFPIFLFAQIPVIDGNYCPASDPALNTSDPCGDTTTGTADMGDSYFVQDGNTVYIGWTRCALGAGTSQYTLLFDSDCDGVPEGAVYVLWGAIGSNCTEPIEVIAEGANTGNTAVLGMGLQGSPDCPTGTSCPEAGKFLEFSVDVMDVVDLLVMWGDIDPCDCGCGEVRLLPAVTLAGGSLSAKAKDEFTSFDIELSFDVSSCPAALFDILNPTVCDGEAVIFDATIGQDPSITGYSWDFGDGNTAMGLMTSHTYAGPGTYTATLSVIDGFSCGNSSTKTVTVLPDSPPVAGGCPADLILECGDNYQAQIDSWLASANAAVIEGTTDDRPANLTVTNNYSGTPTLSCDPGAGGLLVIFTVLDDCGNTDNCTSSIYLSDSTAPVITCPDPVTIPKDQNCMQDLSGITPATATDICITPSVTSMDDLSGLTGCGGSGTIIRTWTATDGCMNTSSCTQNIIVEDMIAPMINCPSTMTVYMDDNCAYVADPAMTGTPMTSDNCAGETYNFNDNTAGLNGCGGTGTIIRTWTATDACSNSSNCDQSIIVEDAIPPTINCPATLLLEVGDVNNSSLIATWLTTASGADNCGGVTISNNYDPNNFMNICGAAEQQLVTFTATDECGNTSNCMAMIIIGDMTPPGITCPSDLTLECSDPNNASLINTWLASVMASDPGGGAVVTGNNYDANAFTNGCGLTGEQVVTFTATDDCMMMNMCTAKIIIVDTTPPSVNCPSATTININGICMFDASPITVGEPTGADECNMNPLMFSFNDDLSGLTSCGGTGLIVRTWTGTDDCNNSSTCTQDITVQDIMPPEITCPPGVTIKMDDNCNYNALPGITGDPAVTDNCPGASYSFLDDVSGLDQCGGTGVISRTWTSVDDCENSSQCVQNINVIDDITPNITGVQDVKASCDQDLDALFADWITNNGYGTATDNCSGVTWTTIPAVPVLSVSPATTDVTFVATDACGNMSSYDAKFSVSCLGVAKTITEVTEAASGTIGNYDVTYSIIMQNNGSVSLDNLNLEDVLNHPNQIGSAFVSVSTAPTFNGGTATAFPNINGGFTGTTSDPYLFDGSSGLLLPGENLVVTFVVEVDPNAAGAPVPMQNQATGTGVDPEGDTAEDDSDSGTDPEGTNPDYPGDTGGEDDPTPLILPAISTVKTFVSYEEPISGLRSHLDVVMDISMKNIGNVPLTNIDLFDDLSDLNSFSIFYVGLAPGTSPMITNSTATSNPNISSAYTGFTSNSNIFDGNSGILEQSQELTVRIRLELDGSLSGLPDTLYNSATSGGVASDSNGNPYLDENGEPYYIDDDSDSGTNFESTNPGEPGDMGTEDDPTPVALLGGIDAHVWKDLDGNGIRDMGEPGIEQITVYLYDCDGSIVDSTFTDVTGNYYFDLLFPGDYYLEFDFSNQPAACIITFQNQGNDDENDSDVNSEGVIPCFSLDAAETIKDLDAGLLMLPCVGSFVWHDLNGNGVQDEGEPGLEGLMVYLYESNGTLVGIDTTDADGQYLFELLYQDDFYIEFEVPEEYELATGPNQGDDTELDSDLDNSNGPNTTQIFNLSWGQCDYSWDAGFYTCVPLGEVVWHDTNTNNVRDDKENGINGIEVILYRKVNGSWRYYDSQFTGHKEGTISDDGYYKFCPIPGEYYIHLKVLAEGLVPVQPFRGNDPTRDGELTGLNGEYTTNNFDLICGEERCDMGFGFYPMASIGDLVWMDDNADGVRQANEDMAAGVVVEAYDIYNDLIGVDTTDQDGNYRIDYLEKEGYFIKIEPPIGYNLAPNNVGGDETVDSDIDHSNGANTTPIFVMDPGVHMANVDAGLVLGVALPIELLSFTGQYRPDYVYLSWQTKSEINTEYFQIERRHENEDEFISIARQLAKGGDSKYYLNDYDVERDGIYYYRLSNIDTDGSEQLSEVISVTIDRDRKDNINIYPNPAVSDLNIEIELSEDKEVRVDIYNTTGQLLRGAIFDKITKAGVINKTIDVSEIPGGVYNVKIYLGEDLHTRRLILLRN